MLVSVLLGHEPEGTVLPEYADPSVPPHPQGKQVLPHPQGKQVPPHPQGKQVTPHPHSKHFLFFKYNLNLFISAGTIDVIVGISWLFY